MSLIEEAVIYLGAAVVAVPLFQRLGLGSVLGYLAAGLAIGPSGFGLISEVENVLHFAEFGVVLLLFLVGLELEPARLWKLRRDVFGLGGAQVLATTAVLAPIGVLCGLSPATAIIVGAGLSLSSTASALQLLSEKHQLATEHGRSAFGILLFQDLAAIPLLALIPLIGGGQAASGSPWLATLKVVAVMGGLVLAGRYVLRPAFKWVASTHSQELFTASALLVVGGTALLMEEVGLSMALGAFLAGVLLANSQYRHELEADIEPFKGLLLGLFFIAVGMSANLALALRRPVLVLALVVGLTIAKAAVLFALGKVSKQSRDSSLKLALVASAGGEFAFVLFNAAVGARVLGQELADLLIVVVSLSMALTPLLFIAFERLVEPRLNRKQAREFDQSEKDEVPVLIAGFGRVGQVVGRALRAKRIRFTALDASSEHVDFLQRFGSKIYYGDASRVELLRAAKADKASIFVLAIDDVDASVRTARTVLEHFPKLTIYARARNRQHAYELLDLGITHVFRETFLTSLDMTGHVLRGLGLGFSEAQTAVDRFRQHDEALLLETYQHRGDTKLLTERAKQAAKDLEDLFTRDSGKTDAA